MAASLLDGTAVDAIIALVAIEGLALVAWRARTGGGPPIAATIANLFAGACLLFALRGALTGASPAMIAASLAVSFSAHGADLAGRWRVAPSSRQPVGPGNASPSATRAPE